jgi:hypothetical protein
MSSKVGEFKKAFGIESNKESEQKKFVVRVEETIFGYLRQRYGYGNVFKAVCYDLGISSSDLYAEANRHNFGATEIDPALNRISRGDFSRTMLVLVAVYERSSATERQEISARIELALLRAEVDIGARWIDGMFYPSGANELDEKLIDDNLTWLDAYPTTRKFYRAALDYFGSSISDPQARKDVLTNAYASVEHFTKQVLGNEKNFENNSNELVTKLSLPKEYLNIFHYYKQIAHGYASRHGTDAEPLPHPETEAFVYMTGLILRLSVQKLLS